MTWSMQSVRTAGLLMTVLLCAGLSHGQPRAHPGGVRFSFPSGSETAVSVVGDFNGWSKDVDPMSRRGNEWIADRQLRPGVHQYKFVVDGARYENDPRNPAIVDNYNRSSQNSVFVLMANGEVLLAAVSPEVLVNPDDVYPSSPDRQKVLLNLIWHQHQPLYADPETDQLAAPWVRTHATKDYFDMAAMLRAYPDVHCTFNLTSSLLYQLREYYVRRLGPYVDVRRGTIDVEGFWRQWKGKTDPWIDIALTPATAYTSRDRDHLYRNPWSAFGISEVLIERFPEYKALRDKLAAGDAADEHLFTVQEQREIIFWFYLSQFDPDFLKGEVRLPGGVVCDLHDFLTAKPDGTFRLKKTIGDGDCRRMVVEAYKVMAAVIPEHRDLRYRTAEQVGQIDIITTPYYHPILPLIFDSDLARICQPEDSLPGRYAYPADAEAQVIKAVDMYQEIFGDSPTGMWPGEGSVAQPVLETLRRNGIAWTASDVKILTRSRPGNQPNTRPYRFPAGDEGIALVFRDTELSDRIGFKYQSMDGEAAAEDFAQSILALAPKQGEPEVLITVILDGENAWEWYTRDHDGKHFLHALYRKLSVLHRAGRVTTVTMSEYLAGNPRRDLSAHPVDGLSRLEWLWPGSWINGNFDTWIGESEENRAWEYLRSARNDLARSGVRRPDPHAPAPRVGTAPWLAFRAWEAMYAAEGSDWFWWYGNDQTAPAGDGPFDTAFRAHLTNVYRFARLAGGTMPERMFPPILAETRRGTSGAAAAAAGTGAMARSAAPIQSVLFTCDASQEKVTDAIYLAGNLPELGAWVPNVLRMRDDGTDGDVRAGDGIWTLRLQLPAGTQCEYKYTNSGVRGRWVPGEEFPTRNRAVTIGTSPSPFVLTDTFGK